MDNIFEHTDSSGDYMYLRECTPGRGEVVKLISDRDVRFTREAVTSLRDALTEWLGDGEIGVTFKLPNLDEENVRRITREEISKIFSGPVVPLFPTPVDHGTETTDSIWGSPCVTCGHTTSVHFHDQGCEHPDGCECAWPDTSAPEKKLIVLKCGLCGEPWSDVHGQPGDPCSASVPASASAPAPEPPSAPGCTRTHAYLRVHSDRGCVKCPCTWTGSAPECASGLQDEYGCICPRCTP